MAAVASSLRRFAFFLLSSLSPPLVRNTHLSQKANRQLVNEFFRSNPRIEVRKYLSVFLKLDFFVNWLVHRSMCSHLEL